METSGLLLSIIAMAVIAVLIAVRRVVLKRRRSAVNAIEQYDARETLCSPAELAFLAALDRAIGPAYRVFAKVGLADVVALRNPAPAARNLILQKRIDFLVCNRETTRPVLAIQLVDRPVELDPAAQARKDRQYREDVLATALASAGISLMFQPAASGYDASELRAAISEHLAGREPFILTR